MQYIFVIAEVNDYYLGNIDIDEQRREDRGEKPFLKNILILNRRNGK